KMLNSDIFVLLGAAGSGKTTLLKYIAFSLSQSYLRARLLRSHRLHQSLPVLLYLRDHTSTIKDKPACTLPELLQAHMQSKGHVTIPVQWFEQQFKRGKCLVMLDGLDEVADEEVHKSVLKWIRAQFLSYSNNRFMLTARPHGYIDTPLDDTIVLNLQPFSPTQIKSFITRWFLIDELMRSEKHDPSVQLRASESAGKLLAHLNQKLSLLELAANPLLLTMIATLASTGGSLPNGRLELYREIFQVLLYRRRDAIGLSTKLSVQQKLEVLQPLAFHMMQKHVLELEYDRLCQVITQHLTQVSSELMAAEFLKDIEQNSGLLLEINPGTWGFAHKTFQEYLAATHLKEKRKESVLLKHINDDWWHETICFYSAQVDATKILQACLAQANTSVQMLNLALECNSQKLKADVTVTQKIEELLQAGIEDADSRKRTIVAEALLKRRLDAMVYLSDEVYIDTSPVSCAEYQLFLNDQSAQGYYYHPWHWRTDTFQPGQGSEPILGVQPLDVQAFCDWLSTRENGRWHYRLPRKEEVTQALSHINRTALSVSDIGFWAEDNKFVWLNEELSAYENLEELVLDQLLLDRAQALAYDRVRARDRREPIDEALELERMLNEMQAPDTIPLLVHGIKIHPLAFNRSYLNRSYLTSDVLREAVNIAAPTVLNYLSLLDKRSSPPYTEEEKHLRWFTRYQSQLQARRAYFWLQPTSISPKKQHCLLRQFRPEKSLIEQEFAFYRRLCNDFALLELREKGKLAPWEGILLVKESLRVRPF
ncbi:MAG: NACHT domain-containing protein, partial [Ktedonobacteraceae bacterium]|nr:NACHT domain-containing protein [Ktedonobacteraceae bacterium]